MARRQKKKFPNHDPKIKGDDWDRWKSILVTDAEKAWHDAVLKKRARADSLEFFQRYRRDPGFRSIMDQNLETIYWLNDGCPDLPQHAERKRALARRERIAGLTILTTVVLLVGLLFFIYFIFIQ